MAVSVGPREPIAHPDTGAAQRRTATMSLVAAGVLVVLKLGTGLVTGSLALVSAGIESSGDVIAALLTLGAIWLAGKPADREHNYGHRRAENIAALGEAAIVFVGGCVIAFEAVKLLIEGGHEPDTGWYVFAVIALAVAIDVSRIVISVRAARRYNSAAFRSNAFNFAGDLAGSVAVLLGLALVAAGVSAGDAIAALVVACVIFAAVSRLAFENVRALMDYAPPEAREAVARAVADDGVDLRRLRLRESGGRYFADVVVGVPPGQAIVEGHAQADAIEAAVRSALPETDVVVHLEPRHDGLDLRDQALAAALAEPLVREAHDITIYRSGDQASISLHLKLAADTSLAVAHDVAERVESELAGQPGVAEVQTHLEPIEHPIAVSPEQADARDDEERTHIEALVAQRAGVDACEVEMLRTDAGLVVFLSVGLGADTSLTDAHELASRLEDDIRQDRDWIADVVVHTEPAIDPAR
ncbi:MAG TPA: cation diffusion facilitator family transporter [Baekduia sp.]|uniref:cation diffusion facilitator family transporter n=1 Tax=Baekduia sp. TaxID=2600305 RepID=UPI002B9FD1A1|nr:cation diffusion facilitator family transporter [Baekduia sp.]HMJ35960.1 cation diffusion facilitator family transporter [Baekduia sp.]